MGEAFPRAPSLLLHPPPFLPSSPQFSLSRPESRPLTLSQRWEKQITVITDNVSISYSLGESGPVFTNNF